MSAFALLVLSCSVVLLPTSSLIFWVSSHHHIFQWLSHLQLKCSFLSGHKEHDLAPSFSFSLHYWLCILCSVWARFPQTSSLYTCSCLLPPSLWMSFSVCWNLLLIFVHLEIYCCSSRFSFSVTFFLKLPLTLLWSIDSPSSNITVRVPVILFYNELFLHLFASQASSLWEGTLGYLFCILNRFCIASSTWLVDRVLS